MCLFAVLFDYQKEILALMFASNMRINVACMFTPETAIRALEFWLAIARRTQMRVQGALVLVALRAFGAYVIPRFQSIHVAPLLDRERRIHEAAPGQVAFQMARCRVRTIAEAATILADIIFAVERGCCNRQQRRLNESVSWQLAIFIEI